MNKFWKADERLAGDRNSAHQPITSHRMIEDPGLRGVLAPQTTYRLSCPWVDQKNETPPGIQIKTVHAILGSSLIRAAIQSYLPSVPSRCVSSCVSRKKFVKLFFIIKLERRVRSFTDWEIWACLGATI